MAILPVRILADCGLKETPSSRFYTSHSSRCFSFSTVNLAHSWSLPSRSVAPRGGSVSRCLYWNTVYGCARRGNEEGCKGRTGISYGRHYHAHGIRGRLSLGHCGYG